MIGFVIDLMNQHADYMENDLNKDKELEMVEKQKSPSDLNLTEGCTVRLENGEVHVITALRDTIFSPAQYIWKSKSNKECYFADTRKPIYSWDKDGKFFYDGKDERDIKEVIARPEQKPKPTYDLKPGMVVELRNGSHLELGRPKKPDESNGVGWKAKVVKCTECDWQHPPEFIVNCTWDKNGITYDPHNPNNDIIRIVSEPEPELKLEVGEFYKTRGGDKVFIFHEDKDDEDDFYPFSGVLVGTEFAVSVDYFKNGRAYRRKEHKNDIVGKWRGDA